MLAGRVLMPRHPNVPPRSLSAEDCTHLEQLSRSHTEPAAEVARAKALLAVADGRPFTEAARLAGRRSGDAVATWSAASIETAWRPSPPATAAANPSGTPPPN